MLLPWQVLYRRQEAAGGEERRSCGHDFEITTDEWYEEINSDSHVHYWRTVTECTICHYVQYDSGKCSCIEAHDLRPAEWPLRYRCADCGYEE